MVNKNIPMRDVLHLKGCLGMEKASSFLLFQKKGISLLEVLVALSLLAIVVLSALAVRTMTRLSDANSRAMMTGIALMRQAGMEFASGAVMVDTNTIGPSEMSTPYKTNGAVAYSDQYTLTRQMSTNTVLGYTRSTYDISIDGDNGNKRFSMYASRIRLLPLTSTNPIWWSRNLLSENFLNTDPTAYQLTVLANSADGTVTGSGYYPHGTVVTIQANGNPGHPFIQWQGAAVASGASTATAQTTIYMDDDKQITAIFK